MPSEQGLRERRREATLAEIKQSAWRQLADAGPGGLSLRAVARDVGVSVQALYHYFDSRDALVTELVADAHGALADAVADEAARRVQDGYAERLVAVGLAYRRWAAEHRGPFLLAYGTPLPDYRAPADGPTTAAAARLGSVMREVVFGGWTPAELRAVPLPPDAPAGLTERLALVGGQIAHGLPPGATATFVIAWGQLHGLVMLDVLDHLPGLSGHVEGLYRIALRDLAHRLEELRAGHRQSPEEP